jgi:ribonuclease HI
MKFPLQFCTEIKIQYNKHIGWRCSLSDLMLREVALSKLTNPYQYPTKPSPDLNVLPFDSSSIQLLNNIKSNFSSASSLQFYTDGSLTSLGTSDVRLGVAWLQTDSNWPLLSFNATLSSYSPSSTLAETVAILAAIYASPPDSNIEICTDSQVAISTFQKLSFIFCDSLSINPAFKIPYFHIWSMIFNLIAQSNISISFTKVKAHIDDISNNTVDKLAKQLPAHQLTINKDHLGPGYYLCHQSIPVITPHRLFIKHKKQAVWAESLLSLPHLSSYRDKVVDWHLLFRLLNDEESSRITSFKGCFKKKFKIKLLLQMLPTLEVIHARIPDTYTSALCFRCNATIEDFAHIWLCPKNNPPLNDIVAKHKISFTTHLQDLNTLADDSLIQEIWSDDIWSLIPSTTHFWILDLIKGIIPLHLSNKVTTCVHTKELSHGLLSSLYHDFSTSCYEMWNNRNVLLNDWKVVNNIKEDFTTPWISSGFPYSSPLPSILNPPPLQQLPLMAPIGQIFGTAVTTPSLPDV